MELSFEQYLIEVWRQALVENADVVVLSTERYPVRRELEQNPDTKSRWAQMARAGKKVMQFLSEGRYVANVVGGKVNVYGR